MLCRPSVRYNPCLVGLDSLCALLAVGLVVVGVIFVVVLDNEMVDFCEESLGPRGMQKEPNMATTTRHENHDDGLRKNDGPYGSKRER